MKKIMISASVLAADFANLEREVNAILAAGVDYIHLDVMDHHFVPNLSFGAIVCEALRNRGITAPIDVHLMVEHPEKYIEPFAKAGASLICFHPETSPNVNACLESIKKQGIQTGLVLNPDKPLSLVEDFLSHIDLLLLMSVYPGFSGQTFIESSYDKLNQAHQCITQHANPGCRLGIDGGVKISNINKIVQAGADFCIVGSGLFAADDYQLQMQMLREQTVLRGVTSD